MKIKTFLFAILLLLLNVTVSCVSMKPGATPGSVEEAETLLAKQAKQKQKAAKKEQKIAYKHFWSLQSKAARKSIKKNKKRNKRFDRQKRRAQS